MPVKKAIFKEGRELEDTRFAPNAGETVFIVDDDILIFDDEIIRDFDVQYYIKAFEIIEEE